MQSLFPYQASYKPLTWDRYYIADENTALDKGKEVSTGGVSSAFAAAVTIAIFFIVFILTFGCRMYSEYVDRGGQRSSRSSRSTEPVITEQMASDFWICGVPRAPPPPYEVAILMPTSYPQISPTS